MTRKTLHRIALTWFVAGLVWFLLATQGVPWLADWFRAWPGTADAAGLFTGLVWLGPPLLFAWLAEGEPVR